MFAVADFCVLFMLYMFVVTYHQQISDENLTSIASVFVCAELKLIFFSLHLCFILSIFSLSLSHTHTCSHSQANTGQQPLTIVFDCCFFHENEISTIIILFYIIIFNQSLKFMCKKTFCFSLFKCWFSD